MINPHVPSPSLPTTTTAHPPCLRLRATHQWHSLSHQSPSRRTHHCPLHSLHQTRRMYPQLHRHCLYHPTQSLARVPEYNLHASVSTTSQCHLHPHSLSVHLP